MAGQQQQQNCVNRYPNLRITVKKDSEERSVKETSSCSSSNPRAYRSTGFYPMKTVYYNSNYRHTYRSKPCEEKKFVNPSRRYRKKFELDWDHTFDLDQLEYSPLANNDSDNQSLISSSDQSYLSI